jgi:hypothetical protein
MMRREAIDIAPPDRTIFEVLSRSNEASLRLQRRFTAKWELHPRLLHQPVFACAGRFSTVGAGGCHLGG